MQLSADSGKGKTKKSKHKAQHKTVFDVIGRPSKHHKEKSYVPKHPNQKKEAWGLIHKAKNKVYKATHSYAFDKKRHMSYDQIEPSTNNKHARDTFNKHVKASNHKSSSHKSSSSRADFSRIEHGGSSHHTSTTHHSSKPMSKAAAYHQAVKHAAGGGTTHHTSTHAAPTGGHHSSSHSSHGSKPVKVHGNGSIVDYMHSKGMDYSFGNRAKLAKQYGIHGYTGSAQQNLALLGHLQSGSHPSSSHGTGTGTTHGAPPANSHVSYTKPVLPKVGANDQKWYDTYGHTLETGTANYKQYQHYLNLQKKYGLKNYQMSNDVLHKMSLSALGGDKNAQTYLKNFHVTAQDAKHGLWNGYDPNKDTNKNLQHYYRVDNPNATYTKNYDNGRYNAYNDLILNNKQMTDDQMKNYNRIVGKYHLQDMTDPYNQQVYRNDQQRKQDLNAQDIATNQSLATSDAQNFQAMQQQQQNMADRGITDSGIAAGAYQQSIAANNQNISQAYANAAQAKADINQKYNDLNYGIKQDQAKSQADQAALQEKAANDIMTAQTAQDKYMTQYSGFVWANGKPLTLNGKKVPTVDYMKMTETQRHNLATENNIATKNSQDYALGQQRNQNDYTKIQADLQKSIAKNKLDYAKLDFNYAKLKSQNSYNQAKLKSLADASSDRKKGQQLTALGKQSSDLSHQIQAYQKKGKKPPKDLVNKYNNVNNSINKLIGGMSFSDGSGGTAKIGSMGTYNNYWKTQKEFAHSSGAQTFVNRLSTVVKGGEVPQSWMKAMIELAGRESSWNPNANNPKSTAHGYAQFLDSTERLYKKRYPNLDYSNPTDQIILMYHYIKDRYGTPTKALAHWDSHNWY